MGSQIFRLGDLVGPEGLAVLVGRADNSANLQVGREESMGAILEVQVVGHLVGPGVGHPMDPELGGGPPGGSGGGPPGGSGGW